MAAWPLLKKLDASLYSCVLRTHTSCCLVRYGKSRHCLNSRWCSNISWKTRNYRKARSIIILGGFVSAFAVYNQVWEAPQRRRLRVDVEGVGRFFRWILNHFICVIRVGMCGMDFMWCHVTTKSPNSRDHFFDSRNRYSSVTLLKLRMFGFLVIILAK